MKRILALLLCVLLMLSAFVSCSPKKKDEGKEKEPAVTAKKTTTSKHVEQGIEPRDEGWAYWNQF